MNSTPRHAPTHMCARTHTHTLQVQMGGANILTDPIFSERCSPTQMVCVLGRCGASSFLAESVDLCPQPVKIENRAGKSTLA